MNSLNIAKKCETTDRIVRYRIKKLMDEKVIMGFRAQLDINKINKIYVKIRLWMKQSEDKIFKKLIQYGKSKKEVVYACEAIGGADYEIEVQVKNTSELYNFIDELRETFGENIAVWNWMEYIEEVKLSYLEEL